MLAGVRQVQGTINGLGERCGNANLMSLIPTFFLMKYFSSKFEIQIKKENIKNLTQCSRLLDEILNRKPNKHLPTLVLLHFLIKEDFMFLLFKRIQKHMSI